MPLKKYRPVTPSLRFRIGNAFAELTTDEPERSLVAGKSSKGGRNNQGRMTMRYRGGGHKRRYRVVDFRRNKPGVPGTVQTIEYDPNRSAFIALLHYADGEKRYILAPAGIKVGDKLESGKGIAPELGNALPISEIPLGTVIHNVELSPGKGGQIARGAGSSVQLVAKEDKFAVVKMPSGETRKILLTCMATVGVVSNSDHNLRMFGKAGAKRWTGRRPRNRGVAMNPVDHPMGGGEGKASGGHPRSRKGLYAKGQKTRHPKRNTTKFIITRRPK